MIKSLLILILLVALAAGAFLTRPTPEDFNSYVHQQFQAQSKGDIVGNVTAKVQADNYLKHATVQNRFLWSSVQKDGKSAYIGAFGHWWGDDIAKK
jgi:hypothetical protein